LSAILEDLSEGGTVGVADLCERLDVSAATIRRDLELLEQQRLLTRTHGGAVGQGVLYELPLRYKSARRQAEKRRIAAAAAERVADGAELLTCIAGAEPPLDRSTVEAAVREAGANGDARGVAVAVDGEVVPRGDWPGTALRDGQRVEVLHAVQGG